MPVKAIDFGYFATRVSYAPGPFFGKVVKPSTFAASKKPLLLTATPASVPIEWHEKQAKLK
jgi:hypothetical protein